MDKRIEKTKHAIKHAYFELLSEKKTGKISVAEIARRANIDRKTFYLHYESTDDIVKEYCKDTVYKYIAKLEYHNNSSKTFSVNQLFEILNSIIADNVEIFELITNIKENNSFFQIIKEILYEAVWFNLKEPLGISDLELTIYTEYYISAIIAVYKLWLEEDLPISMNNLSNMVSEASLKGLDYIIPKCSKK